MGWQLFIKGISGKTTVLSDVDPESSIDNLMKRIAENQGIDDTEQLRVLYSTKQLEMGQGKVLSDYKIQDMSTLFVVIRLLGGCDHNLDVRIKELTPLPGYITVTSEPCMISFEDDPNTMRAKMPCGHVISSASMSEYAKRTVAGGSYIFRCPDPQCHKEWDFFLVRHVTAPSSELNDIESKLAETYAQKAMGVQQCPRCSSFCMRTNSNNNCVRCPVCSKHRTFDFCWSCLHTWAAENSNQNICGNRDCDGGDPRIRYLNDCPKVEINGVSCPSVRACPSFCTLISHVSGCKHMLCPGCKEQFCCLKKPDAQERWPCGSYNAKCTVAATQTQLVG